MDKTEFLAMNTDNIGPYLQPKVTIGVIDVTLPINSADLVMTNITGGFGTFKSSKIGDMVYLTWEDMDVAAPDSVVTGTSLMKILDQIQQEVV